MYKKRRLKNFTESITIERKEQTIYNLLLNVIIAILFLVMTFIFLLKSPLNIWSKADSATDSSVFRTVAMMMNKGYMPYLHTFDHKGPYIYIVNWIGLQISYDKGIWLIEFINLFVSLCAFYKISRLKCNKFFSVIVTIISVSVLFTYFEGGNFTEEYAIPLIAISIFIFLDYLINGKINKIRLIVCGVCFGGVLLLRPNMISTWIVFSIAVLIKCIKEKQLKELINFIIVFLSGVGIIVIPIIAWIGVNGALLAFWTDYIEFNKLYSSTVEAGATFENKWYSFFFFFNQTVVILSSIIILYVCYFKRKMIYYVYAVYIFVSLLFICMSGRNYGHYGMVIVPVIVFPFAVLYELCDDKTNEKTYDAIKLFITMYLIGIMFLPKWITIVQSVPSACKTRNGVKISSSVQSISNIIDERTNENEKISVYGNWDMIYIASNRIHATKYSYQFPIGDVSKDIMDEYFVELKEELPSIIVVEKDKYDYRINSFLNENKYKLIWKDGNDLQNSASVFQLEK